MQYILRPPGVSLRINEFKNILQDLMRIRSLDIKLKFCLPLLLAAFGGIFFILKNNKPVSPSFWYKRQAKRGRSFTMLCAFTMYLFASYLMVTTLNIYNNQKNVQQLKASGFFENTAIIPEGEFEKRENIDSMNEMIDYYKLKGDLKRIDNINKLKKEIYNE